MISCLLLSALAPKGLHASPIALKAFGHEVEIYGALGEQKLVVDGREVLENWSLGLEGTAIVDGIGILIGTSNTGGNACDVSPFVISFPPGQSARIDGPLANCHAVTYTVHQDIIRFETQAGPAHDGDVWSWTPAGGFEEVGTTSFTPDQTKGWAALRERSASNPGDLLDYGEIANQIDDLLGPDREEVLPIIAGVGSGHFDGDAFVGSSCLPHMCTFVETMVFAHIPTKKVFLAWKLEDEPVVIRPKLSEWPQVARMALVRWANTLQ
jgi:hypothetical protein